MHTITLSRGFIKQGIIMLFFIFILAEGLGWSAFYEQKRAVIERLGGVGTYLSQLVRALVLPELVTVLLLTSLMYWVRRSLAIKFIKRSWLSIVRYELVFLPLLVVAFWLIIPFTQSGRFLIEYFPNYSISSYWQDYILHTYTWSMYFKYLVPLLFIGYGALNLSLLLDYFKPADYSSKQ